MLRTLMSAGAAVAVVTLLAGLACSEQGSYVSKTDHDAGSPIDADITERRVIAQGAPPLWFADSLAEMVKAYPTVVVGEVVGAMNVSCPEDVPTEHDDPDFPPPDHPKAKITPVPIECEDLPPTGTLYSVRVLDSLRPGASAGDLIAVGQVGGIRDGVEYHLENDPAIRVGLTYLFFLHLASPSDPTSPLTGSAFGRFAVDPTGTVSPVDPVWNYLPAVAELSGQSLDQADSMVDAAAASDVPIQVPDGSN